MTATLVVQPLAWGQPVSGLSGINERCVELPIAANVARLWQPGRVLDAGCSLNHPMTGTLTAELTHLTLTLRNEPHHPTPPRQYVQADVRSLSQYADRAFDRVICVSSLEHVGCDNSRYDGPVERCPESVTRARDELWRVTGDLLLITVPFRLTPWRERGWRYFTPETLGEVTPPGAQVVFYRRALDGWGGPFLDPAETPFDDEPWRVPQIAGILACR